jgi:hypothetical protein
MIKVSNNVCVVKWKVRTYIQEVSQLILGDFFQQWLGIEVRLLPALEHDRSRLEHPNELKKETLINNFLVVSF